MKINHTLAAAALLLALRSFGVSLEAADQGKIRAGVCEREAEKLLGQRAARVGGSVRPPRKIRGPAFEFPELPTGTTAMGMWVGETLIDTSGKVSRVWPLREVRFKPAFPAFNQSIVDTIHRWVFEPLLIDGKPTPVCMTVSTNLDFQ